jgi:hypothetical protein
MEIEQERERIANLTEKEVGYKEENVKNKIIVPLLALLGHKIEDLDFEYGSKRKEIDIFVNGLPNDCKVIIDTKKYNENLNDHIEQIKDYTFMESPLLTIIANGNEIRIYSLLRGVAFEKSLLYSIKREHLTREPVWRILLDLLSRDNLKKKVVLNRIEEREREIKDAMANQTRLKEEYESRIEGIDSDIETKEDEIDQLKKEKEDLGKEANVKTTEIWNTLGLPLDVFAIPSSTSPLEKTTDALIQEPRIKARKVTLQELVDAGLVKNGQNLFFIHSKVFKDEQAEIVASQNKLKYKRDGKLYSVSELAKFIDRKAGLKHDEHGVAGPKYWQTEDGKVLHDLNELVREKERGRK